jgi:hypothetical protein
MDNKKTEDYLRSLEKPEPPMPEQKDILKVALMNARKSSAIGLVLVGLPTILIVVAIIQNIFDINVGFSAWLDNNLPSLPIRTKAVIFFIFLVGFPIIAIAMNMLSITYFKFDKTKKEFDITIKIRWWNIIITITGALVASFYILHILADSLLGGK